MKRMVVVAVVMLLGVGAMARGTGGVRDGANQKRLDQAAAYVLEGKPCEARQALDAGAGERQSLQLALVRAMLELDHPDAFGLLTETLEAIDWGTGERDPFGTVVWQILVARYAAQEGYRSIASFVLQRSGEYLGYVAESTYAHKDEKAKAAADRDEVTRELARLEEGAPVGASGASATAAAAAEADTVAPVLERLLASPRLALFRETPLPDGITPVTPAREDDAEAEAHPRFPGFTFPDRFAPVRAERQGDEAVAIGLSQDYDPVGEISGGAYWVIRSHDGGKTWGRRLYTGLRIEAPYVIHAASNLALLSGDHLDVEVSVRELDESSISFPPVALRAKREQDGLMLTIPFADLERDSDRDGLTDLAEERLITDPANPDTDGDGLLDGDDPLPQVAWSGVMDDEAAALAAVLENIAGMRSMAIIHGIRAPGAGLDDLMTRMQRATLTDQRTSFIVGERRAFRSLATSRRAVVLTRHEVELARQKFGPLLPLEFPLFVLDHEARRGYVIWDASWVGGSLTLEKSGSTWRAQTAGSWIT